jgi:hypothetical protein
MFQCFLVRRPYLQYWRCENPLGDLQLILFLYLDDHVRPPLFIDLIDFISFIDFIV